MTCVTRPSVYARRQNGANGGWIEGWRRVGKPFEGDAGVTNLTAAATSDGRLELSVNGVTPTREWLERLVQPNPNADFDPNVWVKVDPANAPNGGPARGLRWRGRATRPDGSS